MQQKSNIIIPHLFFRCNMKCPPILTNVQVQKKQDDVLEIKQWVGV